MKKTHGSRIPEKSILETKKGILLDIGCGANKQGPNWVGMDKRPLPGVDIVHDLEVFPYPIEDGTVITCVASHVVEHIKPWLTLDFFNEIWRILKPGGQFSIVTPYATSHGYFQDPTHCNPFNDTTFLYFDPYPTQLGWGPGVKGADNYLYNIYKPKPWAIEVLFWSEHVNIECVLRKRSEQ